MLVLSRKVGERILIGENIAITVVKIAHGGVRIGIDAPAELAVVREELRRQLKKGELHHGDVLAEGELGNIPGQPQSGD